MSGRGSKKSSGAGGSDLLELYDRCPCRTEQCALALTRVLSDHVISKTQTHSELRGHLGGRNVSIQKKTHRATTSRKRTWLYSVGPATRPALYSPQARTMTACRISMYGTCELSWSRPCAEASMLSQRSKRRLNVEKANLCGIRVGG